MSAFRDEIEALRAKNATLEGQLAEAHREHPPQLRAEEVAALRKEREEALRARAERAERERDALQAQLRAGGWTPRSLIFLGVAVGMFLGIGVRELLIALSWLGPGVE